MRILASFAFSFAAAVFMAIYGGLDAVLLPLGSVLAAFTLTAGLILRRKNRSRTRTLLILSGLAAGFLWTAVYMAVFFQPAQSLDNRTVRLTATVTDWPQEGTYGGYTVLVQAKTESWTTASAILYLDEQGASLRPGDRVTAIARCTLGDRTFAGEKISYYTAKGIFLRAKVYGKLEIDRPEQVPPQYWAAWISRALKQGIAAAFPEDSAGLVQALVTGNRDNLTDSFTTSLERTGLSHTVAVSGMHLAFLTKLLNSLLGRGRRSTAVFTIFWVVIFCGIAGNTPSVLRAAVMVLMLQFAPLLNRERDGATSLALALFLLLFVNPFSAAHVGLQLSFAAVAGILLVSDRLQEYLLRRFHLDKWPKSAGERLCRIVPLFIISTISATVGASVLTVPLTAVHFHTVSLIAPLSNLMTLWAIGLLFLGGLGVGALAHFFPAAATVLALPLSWLVQYLQWVVDLLSKPALAALSLEPIYYRFWLVFVYVLLLAGVRLKWGGRLWIPAAGAAAGLLLAVALTRASFYVGDMAAAVLDVGQGQCVLLRTGKHLALVDCGGDGRDNPGDTAANYLQSLGRSKLDLLVVSHYHADHANGIPQLLQRIPVDKIALPDVEADSPLREEILTAAENRGVEVVFVREDLCLELEENRITIFAPMAEAGTTNELGLTVLASAGSFDALITGDMEREGELRLAQRSELPDIELLVAGHHGSDTSNTQELLERVTPELALISVGLDNKYGHPGWNAMARLDKAGAQLYRTDLYGTILVNGRG